MVTTDEDALICDFAETYGIYNYKELPIMYAATLASGLRDNSRIKMAISGAKVELNTLIMAATLDRLSFLAWAKTKDGENNKNRPASIVEQLIGKEKEKAKVFESPEGFNQARQSIIDRINGV